MNRFRSMRSKQTPTRHMHCRGSIEICFVQHLPCFDDSRVSPHITFSINNIYMLWTIKVRVGAMTDGRRSVNDIWQELQKSAAIKAGLSGFGGFSYNFQGTETKKDFAKPPSFIGSLQAKTGSTISTESASVWCSHRTLSTCWLKISQAYLQGFVEVCRFLYKEMSTASWTKIGEQG